MMLRTVKKPVGGQAEGNQTIAASSDRVNRSSPEQSAQKDAIAL